MPTRPPARAIVALTLAIAFVAIGLWNAAGQTTDGPITVCRMGDPVPKDHPYAGHDAVPDEPATVMYHDADGDGTLDPDEPLYVDAEGPRQTTPANVSGPDVRWTDHPGGAAAGTRPAAGDADLDDPLTPLGDANVTFVDTSGDRTYSPGEPIAIDVDGSRTLSPNDRYLAPADRAGDTATSDSTDTQTALHPLFLALAWVDTDEPETLEGRLLFGDLDFDGRLGAGDLCLSHHDVDAATASPGPTKATDDPEATKATGDTTTPRPSPSPSPTTTATARQPGGFDRRADEFEGRYVRFALDAQEGLLTGLHVHGVSFLDEAVFACPCTADLVRDAYDRPTAIRVESDATSLVLHDQPSGLLTFTQRGDVPLGLRLADGTDWLKENTGAVRLTRDGDTAWLAPRSTADGPTSQIEVTSDADGGTRLIVHGAAIHFLSRPADGQAAFQTDRDPVERAILAQRLAVEVHMLRTERGNEPQVLAYEPVQGVNVRQPADLEYEVEIDAEFADGRAFLFQFPSETLPAREIELRYFHQADAEAPVEVRSLVEGASLQAVLDADSPGQATYYVEATPEGFQVAVAVPDFSIQLFQVLGIPPETAPIFAYGVVLVFLFLGVSVMGVMIGRRGRPRWQPKRKELVPLPRI